MELFLAPSRYFYSVPSKSHRGLDLVTRKCACSCNVSWNLQVHLNRQCHSCPVVLARVSFWPYRISKWRNLHKSGALCIDSDRHEDLVPIILSAFSDLQGFFCDYWKQLLSQLIIALYNKFTSYIFLHEFGHEIRSSKFHNCFWSICTLNSIQLGMSTQFLQNRHIIFLPAFLLPNLTNFTALILPNLGVTTSLIRFHWIYPHQTFSPWHKA